MMNAHRTSVEIEGLTVRALHGVDAMERDVPGEFRLDVRLDYDASEAMRTDDIAAAINYAAAIEIIRSEMSVPSRLLEHAAARVRDALVAAMPQISGGRIRLAKLHPPVSAQLAACAFVLEW